MFNSFFRIFLLFLVAQHFNVQPRSLESTSVQSLDLLQNLEGLQKGETAEGVAVAGARKYLKSFGYLDNPDSNNIHINNHLKADDEFNEGLETAIKKFQEYYHLNVSGKLDSETIKLMSLPRCGFPDSNLKTTSKYAFFKGHPQWPDSKNHLTYRFQSGVEVPPIEVLRNVFRVAFGQWSNVSSFTFEEVANGAQSDLEIGFFRGDHGDGFPFDHQGVVLAHAFSPIDGRLHLNAEEPWSSEVPMPHGYFDLVWVAMHEIGHLLGLDHSSHHDAIMYAIVEPGINRRELTADDIAGIKGLYSSPDIEYSPAVALRCDYYPVMFTFASSLLIFLFCDIKFRVL